MAKTKTILDFFSSPKPPSNKNSPATKSNSNNAKSPKTPQSNSKARASNGSAKKRSPPIDSPQFSEDFDDSIEEDEKTPVPKNSKRRRIVIASDTDDDSADEYKPGKDSGDDDDDDSELEAMPEDEDEDSEAEKPKKRKSKSLNLSEYSSPKSAKISARSTPKSTKSTKSSLPKPSPKPSNGKASETSFSESQNSSDTGEKEWVHLSLEWLKDDKIRDKEGRWKSDPNYDPKTLFVPDSFKKNTTPAHRQWWEMKADHFDTVLFFKVGKFYELYHMDAVVGVNELGIVYMKGDYAHSGFPEIAYTRFADSLVERGYKVARVEQTETPLMMEERCLKMDKPTKFDKVVQREICQITSKGTRTYSCQDGVPMSAESSFLLCIAEKVSAASSITESEYGVCFIDTSFGKFYVGQFTDDRHCSRLRTLTVHYPPIEILYERDSISKKTLKVFRSSLSNIKTYPVASKYWNTVKILKFLMEKKYFNDSDEDGNKSEMAWPDVLKNMLDEDDKMCETAKKEYELAMKAFSACVWYLRESLIEDQLLTMKLFENYVPSDDEPVEKKKANLFAKSHMILDGTTLRNLEIVENSSSEIEGTLFHAMDFCSTNFGKRLLRQWMCSPLCDSDGINDRLDAIEDLENVSHVVDEVVILMKKLPDLERLLSRVHSQSLPHSKDHPDGRAIFFEEETYSKRKLLDFLSILQAFKSTTEIITQFKGYGKDFKSKVLTHCVTMREQGGGFPCLKESLEYFDTAFNHEQAKKDGRIIPRKGVDEEYDSAIAEVEEAMDELEEYLLQQKKKFQCRVSYFGTGKNRFQLEVPESAAKHAGEEYELHSQKKGFKRFYTKEIKEMSSRLIVAEDRRDAAQLDIMRRIFAAFDKKHEFWKSAVQCLSVLDVLMSMTLYKKSSQVPMCRPEVKPVTEDDEPFLKIIDGRHPILLKYFSGDYIPNSVYLGSRLEVKEENLNSGGKVVLVTGPNMGGKSTLMRQVGLLVVMAQMGSYVPADECVLTAVDRIFTRLGASDCITAGESTFFVEVSETSCILQHATKHSLVLIDELGRGTSTHDGVAIAISVVKQLSSQIDCRTLFSTHYHNLVNSFESHPNIGFGHMACMVEDDESCPVLENITFLYKFKEGICPKSYGYNVAYLAGIPAEIVKEAIAMSRRSECDDIMSKALEKEVELTRSMLAHCFIEMNDVVGH